MNSELTGLRALAAHVMLERANEMAGVEASELWYVMQHIGSDASLERLPRATLQLAMDLNRFPVARDAVEKKALAYEDTRRTLSARSIKRSVHE